MADEVSEFEYTLAGRTMRFRYPHGGQLIMLQRMRQRALNLLRELQGDDPGIVATRMQAISSMNLQTLDLIESLFLDPEDVAFVEQKMIIGEIDLPDLLPIMSGGKTTITAEDDDDPQAPPAILKTKKAAPAKAAKKANPRRVAR
jgi:hypothetical protein